VVYMAYEKEKQNRNVRPVGRLASTPLGVRVGPNYMLGRNYDILRGAKKRLKELTVILDVKKIRDKAEYEQAYKDFLSTIDSIKSVIKSISKFADDEKCYLSTKSASTLSKKQVVEYADKVLELYLNTQEKLHINKDNDKENLYGI